MPGFQAETYTVTPEAGLEAAMKKMQDELVRMAESEIRRGYDDFRNVKVWADYTDVRFMYILLPIWFTGFTYQGKFFVVTISGATGEVRGAYNKSGVKIAVFVGAIIAVLVLILYLISR